MPKSHDPFIDYAKSSMAFKDMPDPTICMH